MTIELTAEEYKLLALAMLDKAGANPTALALAHKLFDLTQQVKIAQAKITLTAEPRP